MAAEPTDPVQWRSVYDHEGEMDLRGDEDEDRNATGTGDDGTRPK
jgi:hypothetical protein